MKTLIERLRVQVNWDEDAMLSTRELLEEAAQALEARPVTSGASDPDMDGSTEVRLDGGGELDEVVGRKVDAQIENLDTGHWFIEIGNVAVWLHSKTRITASYERREPTARPATGGEPMKLHFDNDWLKRTIDADPDDMEISAGGEPSWLEQRRALCDEIRRLQRELAAASPAQRTGP